MGLTVWTTATAAVGQASGNRDKQAEAEKVLGLARKAIKQGDYTQAEALIGQAEKLGVKYHPLTERFVDTPDKMRKLLVEERSKSVAARGETRSASAYSPSGQSPATIPADPIAAAPRSENPQTIKEADGILGTEGKSRASALLADARSALARGDKLAALAAWQKAAAISAAFAQNEISPQSVADELLKAGIDPSRLKPAAANAPSPYVLRPADIDPNSDNLPQLFGGTSPSRLTDAGTRPVSPYNLPTEAGVIAQASAQTPVKPASAVAAAPVPVNLNTGNVNDDETIAAQPAPQRLPFGDAGAKAQAASLVAQARVAMDKGDVAAAQKLAEQAEGLNVPDEAFAAGETRPWQLLLEVTRANYRRENIMPVSGANGVGEPRYPVAQGLYNPQNDTTRTIQANGQSSVLARPPQANEPVNGQQLYAEGMRALQAQDREGALGKFNEAWKFESQLDPETRRQLKDKLTLLLRGTSPVQSLPAGEPPSPLEQVNSQQELLRQKLSRELANEEKEAEKLAQDNPKQALVILEKFRERVRGAEVEPGAKKNLLTMVDRKIKELTTFIEQNKATIENKEKNEAVKSAVVRDQEVNLETQTKLAEMVEQFNKLMDDRRFPEAEVLARQARDISPKETVVVMMLEKAKFARAIAEDLSIREAKEGSFLRTFDDVDRAGISIVGDENPLMFGKPQRWADLTRSRARMLNQETRLSPVELEIQKSLTKPVEARFSNRPLTEVMDMLGRMAGVNVYLDPQGLHAEGVTSDTPVTLNLTQPISLKSALNLVLSPLGLSYVIQNEVLRITSEQTRNSNTYAKVYYVADLVIPIPNFIPNASMGLPGAIRESLNAMGMGLAPRPMTVGGLTLAKNEGQQPASMQTSADIYAQVNQMGPIGPTSAAASAARGMSGSGPGGMGGGVVADFDSLINLITTTISPQSWDDVGGPGSVEGFETNLSLVVSQTQDVHEQIADLLDQLRRLQDLQVTIEVRFITLADNFFERIGVDFDFAIDDNTLLNNKSDLLPLAGPGTANRLFDDSSPSVTIGLTSSGSPTADLDIPFTQNSAGSATPAFGNFDVSSAAQFGFAILSDIEVFFVLTAAQGDSRTNILQAPKVTLFNGQSAFVSDTTQRPFVTSVIPVVGDFAAAQMPVIVVLNEGTSMSVQAVVSADRRFVRLTMVPFFSQIGAVDEFTFTGSTTTDSGTTVQDPSNPDQTVTNGASRTVAGTTVQLPTFAFTTVTTTVSVPDGGTVLLGGIKRLREGRTERGVPILSKVPYISRLFKNVGIGREAQSLMMMVTPRIIIQEEEEEKLGIPPAP